MKVYYKVRTQEDSLAFTQVKRYETKKGAHNCGKFYKVWLEKINEETDEILEHMDWIGTDPLGLDWL